MTIITRKQTKTARRPVRRIQRKPKVSLPRTTVTVRLVRPKGTPDAIERGRRLAEEVRKELAVLDNASLPNGLARNNRIAEVHRRKTQFWFG